MIEFKKHFYTKAQYYENGPALYSRLFFTLSRDGEVVLKWAGHENQITFTSRGYGSQTLKIEDFPITWEKYLYWAGAYDIRQLCTRKEWKMACTRSKL